MKNKRVNVRFTPEELQCLESLCSRFNLNKTQVINQAIKYWASSLNKGKGHAYRVLLTSEKYNIVEPKPNNNVEEISNEELQQIIESINKTINK